MAFLDNLFEYFRTFGVGKIAAAIVGIILLLVFLGFFARNAGLRYRAAHGSRTERREVQEAHLGRIGRAFGWLLGKGKQLKEHARTVAQQERETLEKDEKTASQNHAPAIAAAEDQAALLQTKADAAGQEAEQSSLELSARAASIIAALRNIVKALEAYTQKLKGLTPSEEYETENIKNLLAQAETAAQSQQGTVNNRFTLYLRNVWNQVRAQFSELKEHEKEKTAHLNILMHELTQALTGIKNSIQESKIALGSLKKSKRHERAAINAELKKIKAVLSAKKNQLKNINSKQHPDTALLENLQKEIQFLNTNIKNIAAFHGQLKKIYSVYDKVKRNLQQLLGRIQGTQKKLTHAQNLLKKIEHAIATREHVLEKNFGALMPADYTVGMPPHEFALKISTYLTACYDSVIGIVSEDIAFSNDLKEILAEESALTLHMEAFEKIHGGLKQIEAAMDKYNTGLTAMLSALAQNQEINAELAQMQNDIKEEATIENYQKQIDAAMTNLVKSLEIHNSALTTNFNVIVHEFSNFKELLIETRDRYVRQLGHLLGTVIARQQAAIRQAPTAAITANVTNLSPQMNAAFTAAQIAERKAAKARRVA